MKTFKKHFHLRATAEDIFTALTNPLTIEIWTGSTAVMDANEGTEFSLWDGEITGKNLEMVPGKLIVQQWYFEVDDENNADPSIVTIKFHPEGSKTDIELVHTNIPDEAYENITDGWDRFYFQPLKELVEE